MFLLINSVMSLLLIVFIFILIYMRKIRPSEISNIIKTQIEEYCKEENILKKIGNQQI